MTYENAREYINSRLNYGIQPGLGRITHLLELMGEPQEKLKFVHVAGTNGKGSTSSMIAACASEAGYKTGLFTSPYISDFCDRIMIDGNMISHEALADIVEDIYAYVEKMDALDEHVTEFELITAIALEWFKRENCALVVLEAGLGGLEDSTNVIDAPLAAVITKIALDHMNILGSTIKEIAAQKCGIIKEGTTVVTYPVQDIDALETIYRCAAMGNCRVVMGSQNLEILSETLGSTVISYGGEEYELSMCGKHQPLNAVTAIETINVLNTKGFFIPTEAVKKGLKITKLPARLEIISKEPLVILDGSHNVNGVTELCKFIKAHLSGKKVNAVVGMLADKQVEEAMSMTAPLFDSIITVTPKNPRAMEAETLAKIISGFNEKVQACENVKEAVDKAADECDALVIFGSLYLAGEIRPYLIKKYGFCRQN